MLDTEYLRFPVRKLAESFKVENISITGCRAHYNSYYGGNSDSFSHVNKDLILLTENLKKKLTAGHGVFSTTCPAAGHIDTAFQLRDKAMN